MKKIFLTLILSILSVVLYAQMNQKYINGDVVFIETGIGGNIPTDGSESFFGCVIEVGKYVNPVFGVGINFGYGGNDYEDGLGLIGLNTHWKLSPYFYPDSDFDFELFAGLNYGWLSYEDWYDSYYYERNSISYVVPKVGANVFLNLDRSHTFQVGIEPSFSWYVSTNQEISKSVGVFNILGKLRINF